MSAPQPHPDAPPGAATPTEFPNAALCARLNRAAKGPQPATARLTDLGTRALGPSLELHRFELGNGLQVRLVPEHSAPVISYHTWFHIGSRQEQPGKTGLCHLLEHLMFNETKNLPYGQFDRIVEAAGGDSNASTWTDWTQYHLELPASELGLAARIEADRMEHLVLRKPQVVSELEVVANERRQRVEDDIEGEVSEVMYATALRRHPYRWPTIGWMKDIEGFTAADCRDFYRRYYVPNNATLVVVGDFKLPAALRLVQKHYGHLKPSAVPPYERVVERKPRGERSRTLRRATPTEKLALGYPAPAFGDPDHQVVHMISELLFGGRGSRLFRLLVDERQLVSELHGAAAPFQESSLYEIWFSLRDGHHIDELQPLVEAELQRLRDEPVGKAELSRCQNRLELDALQALQTAAGLADQIGFLETVVGDSSSLFERVDAFRQITAADVQRVAQKMLDPKLRTRIEVLPRDKRGTRGKQEKHNKRAAAAAGAAR